MLLRHRRPVVNTWIDPSIEGWNECPALFNVRGFGTRPDGAEIAVDSVFHSTKNRGDCVLHKFWIKTIP